jgi:7-cyano-7-deazaguanine synthase
MTQVVGILSGGLDSTTMVYQLREQALEFTSFVSFNYGQRHKKELDFAKATAGKLGVKHHLIDLWSSGLTGALAPSGSALISDAPVPEGHYAEENMKATVVPNRNMTMISIAGGIAVAEGAQFVAVGVHSGDHAVYPDCRPEFIRAASIALYKGNQGFGKLAWDPVLAPYIYQTKTDIAECALRLGVPLEETWSCYKGGEIHCGKCGTCVERLEAIDEARLRLGGAGPNDEPFAYEQVDPTKYEDSEYWKGVVNAS